MDSNKSLLVRKNNFFTSIVNFLKGLFKKEQRNENIAEDIVKKQDTRTKFINSIREEQDNPETVRLQQAYENNEINEEEMSYKQILNLNKLYKKQIKKIAEELNEKKISINILEKKMAN